MTRAKRPRVGSTALHVARHRLGGISSAAFLRRSVDCDTVGLVAKRTESNPRGVGRPPSEGEIASKNLTIRLKPSEHAAYVAASIEAGVSLGDWIRAQCERGLKLKQKRG